MKSWFKPAAQVPTGVDSNKARAWRFAQSLRDSTLHPWTEEEQDCANQYLRNELDAQGYRSRIYAHTDWQTIKDRTDFGGYSQQERDYRADIIATMEIVIAQSERA